MEQTSNIAVFIDSENFRGDFDAKRLISKLMGKDVFCLKRHTPIGAGLLLKKEVRSKILST